MHKGDAARAQQRKKAGEEESTPLRVGADPRVCPPPSRTRPNPPPSRTHSKPPPKQDSLEPPSKTRPQQRADTGVCPYGVLPWAVRKSPLTSYPRSRSVKNGKILS